MDQSDPWQVVPRQVFTPYFHLLISTAFVVVSRVACHGVTGVFRGSFDVQNQKQDSRNMILKQVNHARFCCFIMPPP